MAEIGEEREAAFVRADAYLGANGIPGAFVEFGVQHGVSLRWLCRLAKGRRVVALDSFKGLPEAGEHDTHRFGKGQFCADEGRVAALRSPKVDIRKGWFADASPIEEPVALVHLDCDLYQSTADALSLLRQVENGAVVLVDDYFCHRGHPEHGVRRAWEEWTRGRIVTEFDRYGWHGKAFVIHHG